MATSILLDGRLKTIVITKPDLEVVLLALNDREGVLSGDYERAVKANSQALVEQIKIQLAQVRRLASELIAANR